ncbi:hypothetical protein [Allorhodopirellula heiligendammensis]|uniref:Uncharacterized protein n=1 Tax=Allorhodopirellula heiligendammensis TaxID=2714739 RepID=A0A5C6BZN3_9BACT|nr:hypothetical protein [Allorhodopirellula heiligendammensis]TWU16394.1 hypothetical protein Poly21_35990 [Allorhodopirellula heiligendammensis]
MARIGIVFGLVLFGLTIAALSATTQKSYTQFLPMMFGIPLLFFGVVALNPHRRGDSVFAALILALVGMVIATVRTIVLAVSWVRGGDINSLSFQLVASMSVVCCVFVVIAGLWRRRRKAEEERVEDARRRSAALLRNPLAVNPPVADPVIPAHIDPENPYQTPAILNESSSTPPTDDPAK